MAKKEKQAESLIAALNFAKPAIKDIGEPYQTHIILYDEMLYSYDGTIATGHPIEEKIQCCPQGGSMRSALTKCKDAIALGVQTGTLSIKSGRFSASIPCLDFAMVKPFSPDQMSIPLDDTIKTGFAMLGPFVKEGAMTVLEAGLKMAPATMVASNRIAIAEFWHGFPIASEVILPKAAIQAVLATPYKLVGFGCTQTSATFWFENKSWIKTQLFSEAYPDTNKILNKKHDILSALPSGFMDGIKAIMPFGNDACHVIYGPEGLRSGNPETGALGAKYEIEGIDKSVKMRAYEWETIGKYIQTVDWHSQDNMVLFFGERLRGAISKIGMV